MRRRVCGPADAVPSGRLARKAQTARETVASRNVQAELGKSGSARSKVFRGHEFSVFAQPGLRGLSRAITGSPGPARDLGLASGPWKRLRTSEAPTRPSPRHPPESLPSDLGPANPWLRVRQRNCSGIGCRGVVLAPGLGDK